MLIDTGQFACKRVPVGDDHAWLEKGILMSSGKCHRDTADPLSPCRGAASARPLTCELGIVPAYVVGRHRH